LSSDRERCISFLSTGWASDSGCAPIPPLAAPPTAAGQQPWQAVKRSSGASSSKRIGAAPSGYAGKVPSARISRGTVGDQGGRLRPSVAGGPRDDAGNTSSAVLGMPRPKAGPSGRPGGAALRHATRPPSPAPTSGGGSSSSASASAARGGAGLTNNDGRRGASGLGASGKEVEAISREDSPSWDLAPRARSMVAPASKAATSVASSARETVRDMGTPLAVHYRARDGSSLGADAAARQRAILNRTAKYGHAGSNSQGTPPPLGGLSPGLAFEGQGPNAKVVPRNVLLVQRAPLLPENTESWDKSRGVKLWAVRSPRGPEVLQIYEGAHKSAVTSHNRPGWHLRACIDFLHALATMLYCLHGPEEQLLLMAPS